MILIRHACKLGINWYTTSAYDMVLSAALILINAKWSFLRSTVKVGIDIMISAALYVCVSGIVIGMSSWIPLGLLYVITILIPQIQT